MTYEMVPLFNLSSDMIVSFMDEAREANEFINPLWRLYDVEQDDWRNVIPDSNNDEMLFAFVVQGILTGVARATAHPKHIENGKVGFYIRPSQRKKKYAPVMIRMIEDMCERNMLRDLTAVVDIKNTSSFKALYAAGWERSGVQYRWNQGRTAIELKPRSSGS